DISPLRALDREAQQGPRVLVEGDLVNPNATRLTVDDDAAAREVVEPLPIALQGRVHRRNLLDFADERLERPTHARFVRLHAFVAPDDLPVGIGRIRSDP